MRFSLPRYTASVFKLCLAEWLPFRLPRQLPSSSLLRLVSQRLFCVGSYDVIRVDNEIDPTDEPRVRSQDTADRDKERERDISDYLDVFFERIGRSGE